MSKQEDVDALFKAVSLNTFFSFDCRDFLWYVSINFRVLLIKTSECWQAMDKWGTIDILVNNAGMNFVNFHAAPFV